MEVAGNEDNGQKASEIKDDVPKVVGEVNDEGSKVGGLNEEAEVPEAKAAEDEGTHDPYAYIRNNGFTSEKYKIEVRNLPKFYGISELKKLLNVKLNLNASKIKAPGFRSPWVYCCFRSEEERDNALKVLDSYKWKGKSFSVKVADPAPDPLVKRRLESLDENCEKKKRPKVENLEALEKAIQMSAMPLWGIPYEKQLEQKTKEAKTILQKLSVELTKSNPQLKPWIAEQKKRNSGLLCKLHDIVSLRSNLQEYRNKCEFTIGTHELTGERAIGFRLGSYASGTVGVAPVDSLKIIHPVMLESVNNFQEYVRNSEFDVFHPETLKGHWRQLAVRYGHNTGQLMLIIGFHPQQLTKTQLDDVKNELKAYFESGKGSTLSVNSLYFQRMARRGPGEDGPGMELLLGSPCIEEIVNGIKFKISPESFFQINSKCLELLMDSVKGLANLDDKTTVLDVCCGTGTIGLCLAKDTKQVLGVEIVDQAVKNANENAAANNIDNCEFFCGKADEILSSVMMRATGEQTVAIVDPPRAGIHQRAVTMLRKANNLNRLVFLSCDPNCAFKNFTELGRAPSKTLFGEPFVPVAAVPVDMFPHTNHFEFVIYFERLDVAMSNATPLDAALNEVNTTE